MSAKWIRSKAWDDEHLTGPLVPVRAVLRAFSSISLAVVLLILVAVYGVLASVPIGLVALLPTTLVYGAALLAAVGVGAVLPTWLIGRAARARGVGAGVRFAVGMVMLIGLAVGSVALWHAFAWPRLRYEPATGSGFRLFAGFVERYKSVQLRRLPGLEMNELEFYGWWPLSLVLVLFVANLVTATIRRIEFIFVNLGVLTVHTGIVVLALGSAFYATHKQEGDMLLLGGGLGPDGQALPGRPDTGFYDNTQVALWIAQDSGEAWEQRRLSGVPRYNEYNVGAGAGPDPASPVPNDRGPLDIRVPESPSDAGVTFRLVGYAPYCELEERWVPSGGGRGGRGTGADGVSMREFHAVLRPAGDAVAGRPPAATWRLIPERPAERLAALDILNIEHTRGMSETRWADLAAPLPAGARHALIIQVPGSGDRPAFRGVYAVEAGQSISLGDTGYVVEVKRLEPEPPFPIITKGYRGARSSVAVVRVTPPTGKDGGGGGAVFDRWVYHRFPEISQDLLDEKNERGGGGMPKRRDADPGIGISYIDASVMQVYADEQADGEGGTLRVLARMPGSGASVVPSVREGEEVELAPQLALRIGTRHENVQRVEVPRVVPEGEREKDRIGNHRAAAAAVEVKDGTGLVRVHWLPFTQYLNAGGASAGESERRVTLADGRGLRLVFGRVWHAFDPPMSVRMMDFQMIPYPHTQTARDYRSELMVSQAWNGSWSDDVRATSLNEPLLVRTPFVGREGVPGVVNLIGMAASVIAPNQYKFSQAGWDPQGWRDSESAVARGGGGGAKRAFARFTILGVGNSPGIHIIATGAVLMSVGIPWAFYVKPWILRRRKRRIQAGLGRGASVSGTNGLGSAARGAGAMAGVE